MAAGNTSLKRSNGFGNPSSSSARKRIWFAIAIIASWITDKACLSTHSVKEQNAPLKASHFRKYLDGSWTLGTAKLVELKGRWYLHIPVTKSVEVFQRENVRHVVGVDRGLRFLTVSYDEQGKTEFISGRKIAAKRHKFLKVRQQLQSKGTKSAKRRLKALSGRENRWMSDVNHRISKTLRYEIRQGYAVCAGRFNGCQL